MWLATWSFLEDTHATATPLSMGEPPRHVAGLSGSLTTLERSSPRGSGGPGRTTIRLVLAFFPLAATRTSGTAASRAPCSTSHSEPPSGAPGACRRRGKPNNLIGRAQRDSRFAHPPGPSPPAGHRPTDTSLPPHRNLAAASPPPHHRLAASSPPPRRRLTTATRWRRGATSLLPHRYLTATSSLPHL